MLAFTEYSLDKDKKQLHKALYYAVTLFCFHISVAISYFAVKYFGIYACLIGFAYAVPAFFVTFIKEEKEQVNATLEAFRKKSRCAGTVKPGVINNIYNTLLKECNVLWKRLM